MLLSISEEYIRQKVGLGDRDADEVQSLSLRGSHLEKIADLDGALKHFTRLQSLDLSHNTISRLEGLKSLRLLKKLNLYYNNVGNLDELLHLRHNTHLEELDLRLNPVAKTAPDYRLILIHLLPNLRRLDERAIRDSERKAALMLFCTSTAAGISLRSAPGEIKPLKQESLRTQHVKSLAKPMNVLDDDDVGIMDILRNTDTYNHHNRKAVTYDPEDIRQMNLEGIGYASDLSHLQRNKDTKIQQLTKAKSVDNLTSNTGRDTFQTKYPNISALTDMSLTPNASQKHKHHSNDKYKINGDPNLKFEDEVLAYTSYTANGHFTPAKLKNGEVLVRDNHLSSANQICKRLPLEADDHRSADVIRSISNLVDRYWNGSRSLISNQNFVGQLQKLLYDHGYPTRSSDDTTNRDKQQVQKLKSEVRKLEDKVVTMHEKYLNNIAQKDAKDGSDRSANQLLSRTMTELGITKTRLRQCLENNKILEQQIANFTKSQAAQLSENEGQLVFAENVMLENARLRQDMLHLQAQLSGNGNFKGLALMLQQSHKSLIETNKHLVKEMEDMKCTRGTDDLTSTTFKSLPRSLYH